MEEKNRASCIMKATTQQLNVVFGLHTMIITSTAPAGGNGNPLQHACLEESMARGARRAESVESQSRTWLWANFYFSRRAWSTTMKRHDWAGGNHSSHSRPLMTAPDYHRPVFWTQILLIKHKNELLLHKHAYVYSACVCMCVCM